MSAQAAQVIQFPRRQVVEVPLTLKQLTSDVGLSKRCLAQILQTYGHGFHGALKRLQRGTAIKAATKLPLAAGEEAS